MHDRVHTKLLVSQPQGDPSYKLLSAYDEGNYINNTNCNDRKRTFPSLPSQIITYSQIPKSSVPKKQIYPIKAGDREQLPACPQVKANIKGPTEARGRATAQGRPKWAGKLPEKSPGQRPAQRRLSQGPSLG